MLVRISRNPSLSKVLYSQIDSFLMSTFANFAIRHEYASFATLGDRLGEVSGLID